MRARRALLSGFEYWSGFRAAASLSQQHTPSQPAWQGHLQISTGWEAALPVHAQLAPGRDPQFRLLKKTPDGCTRGHLKHTPDMTLGWAVSSGHTDPP